MPAKTTQVTKNPREISARGAHNYVFTPDSTFQWRKGSSDSLKTVIKNTSLPDKDPETIEKPLAVYVDDSQTALSSETDYTAESGSLKLTLSVIGIKNHSLS